MNGIEYPLNNIIKVCVLHTYHDAFDYLADTDVPAIGARVWVPFRQKVRLGVVIGYGASREGMFTLKAVEHVLDEEAILSSSMLALCAWISSYYQAPLSEVLPLALPKRLREGKDLKPISLKKAPKNKSPTPPLILNDEQKIALETIKHHLEGYHCLLLQGVTGSGKTEVYLQAIAQLLLENKQVLVLVPEIGLTPQLLSRFQERFAVPIAVIHSHLNDTKRAEAWQAARDNIAQLVIGTRAAIFTPMPNLGLIIIDEEHDASLKQKDGVHYSARDTALVRAKRANIPVILGSATPSLESLYNSQQNKYILLQLKRKALNDIPLHYQLVDLRNLPIEEGLARVTLHEIKKHLNQGSQVLVFINRRGFAPVLLCHACGWIADCLACDSHLTFHRPAKLWCHHCGFNQKLPLQCKKCHGHELIPLGTGTQRLEDFLTKEFPDVTLMRLDRDEVRKKEAWEAKLQAIYRGEAQLLIGTQLLAKGHHFPNLTLVVIVDADAGFYNQDFRAMEQLGQLLVQVAGRAGRAKAPGDVLIQTHLPHHPLLMRLVQQGYNAFASALLEARQEAALPPYHYLAVIRAQNRHSEKVRVFLEFIKNHLLNYAIQVLGPAPAVMARKANQYRMQLLIKSTSRSLLQQALTAMRQWLITEKLAKGIAWYVDVDPYDLT